MPTTIHNTGITFPDNSTQTVATVSGASGIQGLTGATGLAGATGVTSVGASGISNTNAILTFLMRGYNPNFIGATGPATYGNISAGIQGDLYIPFSCTVNSVTVLGNGSSTSGSVEIYKGTFMMFPPTNMMGTTTVSVMMGKGQITSPFSYIGTLYQGDVLRFYTSGLTGSDVVTVTLSVTRF